MGSIWLSLETALRSLLAQQRGIDVTAHNVANVNTPGYSRQDVVLTTTEPYTVPTTDERLSAGQVGTGVKVQTIRRFTDAFLIGQIRSQSQALGQWEVQRDALQHIEVVFNEPSDQGLNAALSQFWSAWQSVATTPQAAAARAALRETARHLTSLLNTTAEQLRALRRDHDQRLITQVQDINDLATQIAQLNLQISKVQALGNRANDLRDRRDLLLDQLARKVNITYAEDIYAPGMVTVHIGGHTLVMGVEASALTTQPNPANENLLDVVWADGTAAQVSSGEIYGTLQARDQIVPTTLAQLDQVAAGLITNVNAQHRTGYGLNNATGLDFFTGSSARDIALANAIASDANNIAAASALNAPGDGSNALAIAGLSRELLMNGGTTSLGDFYRQLIAQDRKSVV